MVPVILVAAGLGVWIGLPSPAPPKNELPPNTPAALMRFLPRAEVAMVRALVEESETLDMEVSGTIEPYRELQIAAEVAGRIVDKDPNLRSGNYVREGQVLYRIDPRDYELEVESLTRRRDQELAAIRELQQDIENAEALLEVAEQEQVLAAAEVERMERLGVGFSSAAELDSAKRSRLASMNQVVTLRNQVRTFETRRSRVELSARLAETELEKAQLNLSRTTIRAPVNGRIAIEQVEKDSYVQRGTQLLVIEDVEKMEVACSIRMDQLLWILDQPQISSDQLVNAAQVSRYELPPTSVDVVFRVAGREGTSYRWSGVLDRFDGIGLDPQSRMVPLRVRVDDPTRLIDEHGDEVKLKGPPILARGMFVDVVIKAKPASKLILVPKLGIKPASTANVIWKFQPDAQALSATPIAQRSIEEYGPLREDGEAESGAD